MTTIQLGAYRAAGLVGMMYLLVTSALHAQPAATVVMADSVKPKVGAGVLLKAIVFARDGDELAMAFSGRPYTVVSHQLKRDHLKEIGRIQGRVITHIAFLAGSGHLIAVCGAQRPTASLITKWALDSDAEAVSLELPEPGSHVIALSQDGSKCITTVGFPHTVGKLRDTATGEEVVALEADKDLRHIAAATLSPDGKTIALAGGAFDQGAIHFFGGRDLKEKIMWEAEGGAVRSIFFSSKGDLVAYGSATHMPNKGGLEVREYPSGKRRPIKLPITVESCAFTPDGRFIAVSLSEYIALIDVQTGKEVTQFRSGMGRLRRLLAMSADGRRLAGCSTDGDILFWRMPKLGP